ncbi:mycofactocin system FadH/OYE family oxidoreductase 1 [Pseudonocardia hydrocarbonoxydans]|uniref:mycofactocin system FadH/OYE family oxidoreductase 1 n=1 Tax=Pseudonocardia hydrocarbonoxydans TaxID=76726 RepID=UPI0011450CE8|nr:mycofactocin system FadH/OYE family oxidoreductase 1 [Pseudonocardia hydrocarbonoxydans]
MTVREGGLPAVRGLADPVALRGRVAPSRVLFGPHVTNLGVRRALSPRHVAYYARRAAGGAGVIVTETASVHGSDRPYERAPLAADCAPGWRAVVDACRPALVLAGLGHAGAQGSSAYDQQALWAPSRVADVASREVPMEMEQPEIDALVAGFATAAGLAVAAGCDGVEIDAGQHSLLRQFLSGLTNHRTDAYADRDRLLREVLAAVRSSIGDRHVLGLRLCCDELAPWAGITPDSAAATLTSACHDADYVVPVRGSGLSVWATRPDLHTPPGFNTVLCARIRNTAAGAHGCAEQRVVLQGSVVDPVAAQAALDDRVCDLVEMTRAQITEPDLVAHVRAGTPERIRPCTLSNQHSTVLDVRNPVVSDEAEPDAGHETDPVPAPDGPARDVLVVGGGPAGLEAARVLGAAGHRVRLVEAAPVVGGALLLAAAVTGRERMGLLVPWWTAELARLGVRVETGVRVSVDDLDTATGDGTAVLLATGSRPGPLAWTGDAPALAAAEFEAAVLAGSVDAALPPGPVVVHDPLGDWTGVGIAEQLAAAGRATVLVTPDPVAGTQLARTGDLAPANARLDRAGVVRALHSRLRHAGAGRARLEHVWTGQSRVVECAAVVDCGHRLPADELWRARPHLPRAGDCVAPRTVYEAVLEGRRAAVEAVLC